MTSHSVYRVKNKIQNLIRLLFWHRVSREAFVVYEIYLAYKEKNVSLT